MFRQLIDMITSRIRKPLVWASVLLLMVLLFSLMTYRISFRAGSEHLRESGNRQLELHARGVESEIERYVWLPRLLGLHTPTRQLLQQDNPGIRTGTDRFSGLRREVNEYLDGMSTRSGTLALFVLDNSGRVLAASNWRRNDSSVGEDMSQRPYFVEAMNGGQGQFYGLDCLSGEPGYYLSSPLRIGDRIIGVAVAKVRLSQLEQGWRKANSNALVTDENGVVILSTNPDWYLRALHPITAERREQLARSLQYHWSPLPVLNLAERVSLSPGVEQWGGGRCGQPAAHPSLSGAVPHPERHPLATDHAQFAQRCPQCRPHACHAVGRGRGFSDLADHRHERTAQGAGHQACGARSTGGGQ